MERAAEACAAAMAGVLPFDAVIRVLNPIVKTGEYPVNQAAVKMLTKVAEHKDSKDVIISHLADIMPGLLRVSHAKPHFTRNFFFYKNPFFYRPTIMWNRVFAKPQYFAW